MFTEEISAVANAAKNKITFLSNNFTSYFLMSILAGVFVGFGVLLISTIGGLLNGLIYSRIIMGLAFGGALSLVIFAGAELFTGNNFVMAMGLLKKTVTLVETLKLWAVCYVGNWLGGLLLALIFTNTGLASGNVGDFIVNTASTKMSLPFLPLFLRAVLCNMLVCLAIWISFRNKTESGKLILIFWCLFMFITVGFEHSIANMSLLSIALFIPSAASVSLGGYFYNILTVTLGNMAGGIGLVALPYFFISRQKA